MFSPELISLVGGGLTGFLFKYMAQKSADQKEMFNQLIQANKHPYLSLHGRSERPPVASASPIPPYNRVY